MLIKIFGKNGCGKCETTNNKVNHLVAKWGLTQKVSVTFHDMDTVEGLAEGAFHDVHSVPTTIVEDGEEAKARWDGAPPNSKELADLLV